MGQTAPFCCLTAICTALQKLSAAFCKSSQPHQGNKIDRFVPWLPFFPAAPCKWARQNGISFWVAAMWPRKKPLHFVALRSAQYCRKLLQQCADCIKAAKWSSLSCAHHFVPSPSGQDKMAAASEVLPCSLVMCDLPFFCNMRYGDFQKVWYG